MNPRIVAIVGPTGVGKTALAVELCERFGGEIVGADSVQVYRGFDIGSSKATAAELRGVAHHMVDVIDADEPIDAARFARLADRAIAEVVARGRLPVVVGGTGLWLRALLRGLLPLPAVDPELRARLEKEWLARGAAAMHERLRALDPATAAKVHPNDQVRVVRALEVHAQSGHPVGELRALHALGAPRYEALTLMIDIAPEAWRQAIGERIDAMLARGWLDEVRSLLERHGPEVRPLQAVGYRQLVEHLHGATTWPDALARVRKAHHLYGKRQRNWFRNDPSVDMRVAAERARDPATLEQLGRHCGR